MTSNIDSTSLEWIRFAEESIRKGDHEKAAGHLWRIAHYFKLNKDIATFREYARRTGDCYVRAAEQLWSAGRCGEASRLYIKAAECYMEIEDHRSAENCDLKIHQCYAAITKNGLKDYDGSPQDLKSIGDYFRETKKPEKAGECYEAAARKAENDGKTMLAGGLFTDAGDISWLLKDVEKTIDNYARAADNYLRSEKHFEAAWYYIISGFLLASLKRFRESTAMAKKAKYACAAGDILILLNKLSRICEHLSKGRSYEAEVEWLRIKSKFKKEYVGLIDSCFRKAKENMT